MFRQSSLFAKNRVVSIRNKKKEHLSFTDILFPVQTNWLSAIKTNREVIDERKEYN